MMIIIRVLKSSYRALKCHSNVLNGTQITKMSHLCSGVMNGDHHSSPQIIISMSCMRMCFRVHMHAYTYVWVHIYKYIYMGIFLQ